MTGLRVKHIFSHPLRDTVSNFFSIRNAKKNLKRYIPGSSGGRKSPDSEYSLVWRCNFEEKLNSEEWGYGMPWGDFHPGSLHQYYDNDGKLSYVSPNETLVLELRKIPKTWRKKDLPEWRTNSEMPEEFTIPVGVGFVHTKKSWKYGWFTADIKLPVGQSYWNAFWTASMKAWPPEIDVFEAYSERGPRYEGKSFFGIKKPNRQIRPNLHYGEIEGGTKEDYGAWDVPVPDCTERFVQYAFLWEQDRIEIYYDGIKVFQCTDSKTLKWFNREGSDMYLIFNHGLHQDHPGNPSESAMLVENVQVWQKKI